MATEASTLISVYEGWDTYQLSMVKDKLLSSPCFFLFIRYHDHTG
ncbi:MAG: hypothetical protein ACRDG4_11600 [Chloroflexota bacterium]